MYLVIVHTGAQGTEEIDGLAWEIVDNGFYFAALDAIMLQQEAQSQKA